MNNPKILVLEDHALTRQILLVSLKSLGYARLYSAGSGKEAFDLLKSERNFDVLICDIQMPGIDGLTFLREAREVGLINALILSSEIAPDLRLAVQQLARLIGYQVLGDLTKPISGVELQALLSRYAPSDARHDFKCADEDPGREDVYRGLEAGEFVPYFQPKMCLKSGAVVGAEVLARWQHPRRGLLAPGQFLQAVQSFGGINEMTQSIARQALLFLKEHRLEKMLTIALNLEAEQLGLRGLLGAVRHELESLQLPAHCLTLELTETGLIQAPIASIENLVRLRLLGCGVSIDDFGAGFSSVQRICEMPCTELKLDASFTRSLMHNPRIIAAVDSLLRLAKNLELDVVAEGIETLEQLHELQRLGCSLGQGYLFSPPLGAERFLGWLRQHSQ